MKYLIGFIIIVLALTAINLDVEAFKIVGTSMAPTFNNGDTCVSYRASEYNRSDVIITTKERHLIKRIVGIPGDTIRIADGSLYVNGKMEDVSYLVFSLTTGKTELKLGPDQYYILGDNRPVSQDSRRFGPVKGKEILGKVFLKWHLPTNI